MTLVPCVAALYVDPRGPYPKLVEHWYDVSRDARTYAGPWPVVAHPACGPWGCLKHQYGGKEGGPELAILGVVQVRRFGGVLEHPANSGVFKEFNLPKPGSPPDEYGGYTIAVNQCDWGHVARKPTWLYCVGIPEHIVHARPAPREPTHWIGGGHKGGITRNGRKKCKVPDGIKCASAEQRRRTPPAFALWLVTLALWAGHARGLA